MTPETPKQTIERLKKWIDDLQSGMYINCVYCGHRYGPKDQVPTSMADALKLHIASCPQHPMHQVLAVLKSGRALVSSAFAHIVSIAEGPTRAEAQAWVEQANAAIAKAEFVQPKTARKKS